jgi:hypothetical protein
MTTHDYSYPFDSARQDAFEPPCEARAYHVAQQTAVPGAEHGRCVRATALTASPCGACNACMHYHAVIIFVHPALRARLPATRRPCPAVTRCWLLAPPGRCQLVWTSRPARRVWSGCSAAMAVPPSLPNSKQSCCVIEEKAGTVEARDGGGGACRGGYKAQQPMQRQTHMHTGRRMDMAARAAAHQRTHLSAPSHDLHTHPRARSKHKQTWLPSTHARPPAHAPIPPAPHPALPPPPRAPTHRTSGQRPAAPQSCSGSMGG